jgi:hypothetical protein
MAWHGPSRVVVVLPSGLRCGRCRGAGHTVQRVRGAGPAADSIGQGRTEKLTRAAAATASAVVVVQLELATRLGSRHG